MIASLAHAARILLAFEYLINGLNWWWKVLPYPSVSDPPLMRTPAFVQAMIDTGFMFDGTKAVEVVAGAMLLANLWVPLVLVILFPVTLGIWLVDFFLIALSVRAQALGWSVLLLNTFLLFAYLRYFKPILVTRARPCSVQADVGTVRPQVTGSGRSGRWLGMLGVVSVALGLVASGWLMAMVVQHFEH